VLWLVGLAVGAVVLSSAMTPESGYAQHPAALSDRGSVNHNPAQIVGPDACAECHESEHHVWMDSAHQSASLTLTRNAEARRIADVLGIRRIKNDDRCASCHYTVQRVGDGPPGSISGVSCESCHNASAAWIEAHSDFGSDAATAAEESPRHLADRLEFCDSMGMARPARLYELAANCYSCHAITDQELIRATGHPSGEGFEFASWTQGDIRHNFVREGSDQNPRSSPERLRVMFLVGASLRLARACDAVGGGAGASVIADAVAALREIDGVVEVEAVTRLIEIGRGVGDASGAVAAAERVRRIGMEISESGIGAGIEALDPLIPEPRSRQ
jgi:hypothetical protein